MNDTSQNEFVDAYRDSLNKAGFNPKNVLMSIPTKKFNKHSKVPYHIYSDYSKWNSQKLFRFYPSTIPSILHFYTYQ